MAEQEITLNYLWEICGLYVRAT